MKTTVAVVVASLLFASVSMSAPALSRRAPMQAVRPAFRVQSVAQLKADRAIMAAIGAPSSGGKVTPLPLIRIPALASASSGPQIAGNPAYRTGNGVLLDIMHPTRSDPQAVLLVQNVEWNQNIISSLMADNPDPVLSQLRLAQPQPSFLATAQFKDLPSAKHTYLLTIGTTAELEGLKVELLRGSYAVPEYTPGVSNIVQELGPDKLSATPGANEVRVLFSYAAGAEPLSVRWYWGPTGSARCEFHHLQFVQLD